MKPVGVIGGGFAGLAAAVELADGGVPVILFEAKRRLGGRAYSFVDGPSGLALDNGQHALMGCYRNTLGFLDRIGASGKLVRQRNLTVTLVHPRLGRGQIACLPLVGPLHALGGILRYRLLTRLERLRAVVAGARILRRYRTSSEELAARTVAEVLDGLGQSENARASLWDPLTLATLNEIPERAAARPFAAVLERALFGSRADSQFILPKVGLSELYTDDARKFIERRGGRVECGAPVQGLVLSNGSVSAVEVRGYSPVPVSACISAVPPQRLLAFLPERLRHEGFGLGAAELPTSPIISAHLWVDRPVLEEDFVGFIGSTTHWAFNRTKLAGAENGGGQCVSTVISAGQAVVNWSREKVSQAVEADLRALLPGFDGATVTRSLVVKEKQATITPRPDVERRRPLSRTAIDNLFLAGDWIQTGLPPTIESAVASGFAAAALAR